MPLYEYHCNTCGEVFEKMVRFSEADQRQVCPQCESADTRKKVSTVVSFGSALSGTYSPNGSSCGTRSGFS